MLLLTLLPASREVFQVVDCDLFIAGQINADVDSEEVVNLTF